MKKYVSLVVALVMALFVSGCPAAPAGDAAGSSPQADTQLVVEKIQQKLQAGRKSSADLADNMKELDALIAKYKSTDKEGAAGISLLKAQLYMQVLEDDAKAIEVLNQVKKDYAGTEVAPVGEQYLAQIKAMAESKKVQGSLVAGKPFPDFTEKDLAGKPLSIASYKGKVVLIDFWATWCGPCRAELPNVIDTYKKYREQGFEIIGISLDKDQAKLESFLKANNMTWPQYFDGLGWQNKVSTKYGVNSIPATYLLDREGKIIAKDLRGENLAEAVAKALKQN